MEHDIAVENVRDPNNRDRLWCKNCIAKNSQLKLTKFLGLLDVERSKSTRLHFLSPSGKSDPLFYNQPDPIPTTLSPDELDCSIDLKGVEDAPSANQLETFFGAIKHIQDANQKNVAPENPDFNPITVMYYNLYGALDRHGHEKKIVIPKLPVKITISDQFQSNQPPEYLYSSYFPKGQQLQCKHSDSVLNEVEKGTKKPAVPYNPKHRQLLDFSTGIPYLDFTCIGKGGHYTVVNRLQTRLPGTRGGKDTYQCMKILLF